MAIGGAATSSAGTAFTRGGVETSRAGDAYHP
jgi:hypothetical protein